MPSLPTDPEFRIYWQNLKTSCEFARKSRIWATEEDTKILNALCIAQDYAEEQIARSYG